MYFYYEQNEVNWYNIKLFSSIIQIIKITLIPNRIWKNIKPYFSNLRFFICSHQMSKCWQRYQNHTLSHQLSLIISNNISRGSFWFCCSYTLARWIFRHLWLIFDIGMCILRLLSARWRTSCERESCPTKNRPWRPILKWHCLGDLIL